MYLSGQPLGNLEVLCTLQRSRYQAGQVIVVSAHKSSLSRVSWPQLQVRITWELLKLQTFSPPHPDQLSQNLGSF